MTKTTITVEEIIERYTYDPIKGEVWSKEHKHARHRWPTPLQPQSTASVDYRPIHVVVIAWVLLHGRFPIRGPQRKARP
jgi:hypothetical protein